MADKNMTPPPMNRNGRGPMFRPREKPKNLKGTLLRLWSLTKGQRKGLALPQVIPPCPCWASE